ncbi:SpoIIE family protein phosphatase [Actinoplanes sp. NPDC026623]|uniref:PP2C family protein-serine/threonine phosphatase n=1 Tax=Actinoplanes sp. NPDC026623 TaxID=3155610 RepID=UPI0033C3DD6D
MQQPDGILPAVWQFTSRPGLIAPAELRVVWPTVPGESLVRLWEQGLGPAPGVLLAEVHRLTGLLAADHAEGRPLLAPWGLLWADDTLTAAVVPDVGAAVADWSAPFHEPGPVGVGRDLYILGVLLFRGFAGRWPRSRQDALSAAGVLGGEWPLGGDVAVRLCLNEDEGRQARDAAEFGRAVRPFLEVPAPLSLPVTAAVESITGWQKAKGRPGGDNEDAAAWSTVDDTVTAIVLDGVTGAGDGGGRWAATRLADCAELAWSSNVVEPEEVLVAAARQIGEPPAELLQRPAAVGIAVAVSPGGDCRLASVGDCVALLCRDTGDGYRVTRLLPEDSCLAQRQRGGEPVEDSDLGVITAALGLSPDIDPHRRSLSLAPGDYLLICSDGATHADTTDAGQRGWRFLDLLEDMVADAPPPALLVSRLCHRADDLGGTDNATALAIRVPHPAEPAPSWPVRPGSRLRDLLEVARKVLP